MRRTAWVDEDKMFRKAEGICSTSIESESLFGTCTRVHNSLKWRGQDVVDIIDWQRGFESVSSLKQFFVRNL